MCIRDRNIGLDPLFIYTFNIGVAGAAVATAISQLVSTLVYLTYILRNCSGDRCTGNPYVESVNKKRDVYKRQVLGSGYKFNSSPF